MCMNIEIASIIFEICIVPDTSGTGLLLDRDTGGFIFFRRWCGQSSSVSRESPGKVRYVLKTGLTVFHTFSHILKLY